MCGISDYERPILLHLQEFDRSIEVLSMSSGIMNIRRAVCSEG